MLRRLLTAMVLGGLCSATWGGFSLVYDENAGTLALNIADGDALRGLTVQFTVSSGDATLGSATSFGQFTLNGDGVTPFALVPIYEQTDDRYTGAGAFGIGVNGEIHGAGGVIMGIPVTRTAESVVEVATPANATFLNGGFVAEGVIATATIPAPAAAQHVLTTSVSGGNGSISDGGTYDAGTQVTVTATPDSGYRVASWSGTDDDSSTANTNTVTMSSAKTVTVTFERIQYDLTATVVGGNGSVSGSGTYDEGTVVTMTATPSGGYRVASWSGTNNDATTAATNTVTMTSDKAVTVTFEVIPATTYTLTTSVVGGNGTVSSGGTYPEGTVVDLTATPTTGYRVASWSGTNDDGSTANTNAVTLNSDTTVSVTFEQITYTLTTSVSSGQGTLNPASGGSYAENATAPLTATPAAYYRVASWSGTADDGSTATTNSVVMTADKTVSVAFEQITYELTTGVVGGNGTLAPLSGTYNGGTVVTLTATPAEGYRVASWSGTDDDNSVATSNAVTMTGATSVTVTFEEAAPWQEIAVSRLMAIPGAGTGNDIMIIQGTLANVDATDLAAATLVTLTLGPLDPIQLQIGSGTSQLRPLGSIYMYTGGQGGLSLLHVSATTGSFMILVRGVDLTGLSSPVGISFDFETYRARTNYVTDIPLAFLAGTTDLLQAKPAKPVLVQIGGKVLILMLRGEILIRDRVGFNLADASITVNFGNSFSETISGFRQLGTTLVMYTRPFGSDGAISNAMFNLQSNTYSITLQNADIAAEDLAGDVELTLDFGPVGDPFNPDGPAIYTLD